MGHITLVGNTPKWFEVQNSIIYAFHMPLFFAVSGFLFGYREWDSKPCGIIGRKIINLGIPYVIFDIAYVLLNVAVQDYVQTNTVVKLMDGIQFWRYPSAHYWFLYALILYFIIASILKGNMFLYAIGGVASAAFYILAPCFGLDDDTYYKMLGYYFAFAAAGWGGFLFSRIEMNPGVNNEGKAYIAAQETERMVFIAVLLIALEIGLVIWKTEMLDPNSICAGIADMAALVCGSAAFLSVIFCFWEIGGWKRILEFLGKRSWYIYLLHSYFLAAARALVKRAGVGLLFQVIIGLAAGIGLPIIISVIAKKVGLFDWIFYPGKQRNNKKGT